MLHRVLNLFTPHDAERVKSWRYFTTREVKKVQNSIKALPCSIRMWDRVGSRPQEIAS